MNLGALLGFSSACVAAALVFVVSIQERRSAAHWFFALGMGLLALESLCAGLAACAASIPSLDYWRRSEFVLMSFLPAPWLAFSLAYARGNSREFLLKWRWPLVLTLVAAPALALLCWDTLVVEGTATAASLSFSLGMLARVLVVIFLLSAILVLMNLERTLRSSVGMMRWRIKFMILGVGVLFAARAYTSSQMMLYGTSGLGMDALNCGALLLGGLLVTRSLARTGHFEVSVYPSQAMLHNSLTLLLAGVYLVIVGVLAKLVRLFGGAETFALRAFLVLVSFILLGVVLLSDRARLFTRRFISRHLQRPLYDYRTVWRTFIEGTARRVEQTELCDAIAKLASEIFQALSVSIWLTNEKQDDLLFAASTSLTGVKAGQITIPPAEAAAIIGAFQKRTEPVDIDSSGEAWAAALRKAHPEEFRERRGAGRITAPMIAGKELVGLLVLGDRVGGVSFSTQDLDLLKSVSDHAAASLLNVQLSQRLSQAKQMEAFQQMSAFFVHDLKNTASTLSLMLQNLPEHYQDPGFREDALRGISKTVAHINDLITRLTVLRQGLAIHFAECDLNELVTRTLSGQEVTPGVELVKNLGTLPKVRIDAGQMQKVLTNLVLNAREAISSGGRVWVQTSRRNGWVELAVMDDGCGMTPEFVKQRLFRPFHSTKQRGIGIGMFHCKIIVEAHGGRIEVESAPGQGAAFRVLLPVESNA